MLLALFFFGFTYGQNCESDDTPPTVILKSELVVRSGGNYIWPGAFDDGSFDDCTAVKDLIFSFAPNFESSEFELFEEIPEGGLVVEIWVTDQAGNQSSLTTLLLVEEDCEVDEIPPVGHFPSGLISQYRPSPLAIAQNEVRVYASSHSLYVVDNCSEQFSSLRFSFAPDEIIDEIAFPYEPGAPIDYEVWVTDQAGNQSSFPVHRYIAEVDESCSEAPTDLIEVSKSTRHVKLSWSDLGTNNSYILEGRVQGDNKWLRKIITNNRVTIRRRFTPGVTYEWRVQVNCGDVADAPFSEIKTFTIEEDAHTLVEGRSEAIFESFEETKIYPSPASHTLTVESPQEIQQIEIFDITGKRLNVVTADKSQSVQLDVSQLLKGQYLVRLASTDGVETLIFTKQ